jgi:hypothetical protein
MRRIKAVLLFASVLVAGCSHTAQQDTATPRPAAATQPGAAASNPFGYDGPWGKPLDLPTPNDSDSGYRRTAVIRFGKPTHFKVAYRMFNCQNQALVMDLEPGEYAIPMEVTVTSQIAQDAPLSVPELDIVGPDQNFLGQAANEPSLNSSANSPHLRQDGTCDPLSTPIVHGQGQSVTWFGGLGPSQPSVIQTAVVKAHWPSSTDPTVTEPLVDYLPNRAVPAN